MEDWPVGSWIKLMSPLMMGSSLASFFLLCMWRHINLHESAALLATLKIVTSSLKILYLLCKEVKALLKLGWLGKPVGASRSKMVSGMMCFARLSASPSELLEVPEYEDPSHSQPGFFCCAAGDHCSTKSCGAKCEVNGLGDLCCEVIKVFPFKIQLEIMTA